MSAQRTDLIVTPVPGRGGVVTVVTSRIADHMGTRYQTQAWFEGRSIRQFIAPTEVTARHAHADFVARVEAGRHRPPGEVTGDVIGWVFASLAGLALIGLLIWWISRPTP